MTDGQKSVEIRIAPEDLKTLKDNGYKLCFAKKVNDTYNVVWQSADKYLPKNTFTWKPQYQFFATDKFDTTVQVDVSTGPVDVVLGNELTLDEDGNLGKPFSGKTSTAITFNNNFGSIHPGLSAYSKDIHGKATTTPIYVSPEEMVSGSDVLTPVEAVQVWFEQKIKTGTMFSTARSKAIDIDLTSTDSEVRLYSGEAWTTPVQSELSVDPKMILTIIAGLTTAVIAHDIATKIATMLTGVYKDITVDVSAGQDTSVKIVYSERAALAGSRLHETRLLRMDPATVDQLTGLTMDAFESLGVGYKTLSATPAG
ncbi:hypothetical protein ACSHWB_07135 [Lentzea sp. HUAS TT2]|uniref:hypothetical protein n=1 Tax=Lentzea sp. HUAS TT2 TaxID=3447454 RepID=UPI003F703760